MAQHVKTFLHRIEELNSEPLNACKCWVLWAVCIPSAMKMELGGPGRLLSS